MKRKPMNCAPSLLKFLGIKLSLEICKTKAFAEQMVKFFLLNYRYPGLNIEIYIRDIENVGLRMKEGLLRN